MNGYMTAHQATEKWHISLRMVQILCKREKVEGALKVSRIWIIPEDAKKPITEELKGEII